MLTEAACKNASCPPELKRRRLTDAAGLYLEVSPAGAKRWFWKFYPDGKESRLALGSYPEVTLKAARLARDEARRVRQAGTNPVQARRVKKLAAAASSAITFEAVAREYHGTRKGAVSALYAERWLERMEKDLFPWIGSLPLTDVTAPLLLQTLRRVEARGARETAHTLRQTAGQVFRYGIATGRCERNPAPDLHGALQPVTVKHMAALLEPGKAGELMRSIAGYPGQPSTRVALLLSALLFQRPANVRMMEWAELDLDGALWTIPAAKMKRTVHGKTNGRPHLVPLPKQAVEALKELQLLTGHGRFAFPSLITGERPMSENTVNTALRRMGYGKDDMTAHGFRSMARTIIAERLPGIPVDVIEAQLAHGKSGPLGMAYDRAEYMEQRRVLMQTWADYLDQLRAGAKVIEFKAA
ncbi:integrase arm-type DNA-binding domain-containing protein [Paucibacter sediminis]|uniref:Integrase arm-type DNA-binding domain-containing protein n=1 Tax=Paucibacter sediminis TaxID=3019553 RepID=A0AA95SPY4_9BURK|nr:integrase arm-type DNA-binding domain-containing protein [Paucibacter sp. S2-9]WIT11421.1 integrase arm-type DNA-binding domain-containing protein [Paucibacter sp. S2-9]